MKSKALLSLLILFTFLQSCGPKNTTESPQTETPQPEKVEPIQKKPEPDEAQIVMLGTWKGEMGGKKLTVVIEKVENGHLSGYNQLDQNKRPLDGTYEDGTWDQPCTRAFEATLNEPGDDKYDGVFQIKFVGYEDEGETADGGLECLGNLEGGEALGSWKSNDGKLNYTLTMLKDKN
ncbi:MAG: hypothetical protein H6581_10090 [Bacteroidia bacterium]|nr:hypothetical protein [Bacteroidia bacterium]